MKRFFKGDVLISFPRKQIDKLQVLKVILEKFDHDKRYSEKEVNAILKMIYNDYTLIRRSLIDLSLLKRTADGKEYWR